jgi:hypothetical protein
MCDFSFQLNGSAWIGENYCLSFAFLLMLRQTMVTPKKFLENAGGIILGQYRTSNNISAFRVSSSKFPDSNIVLVDTPAFNDTDRADVEVLNLLADWLNET